MPRPGCIRARPGRGMAPRFAHAPTRALSTQHSSRRGLAGRGSGAGAQGSLDRHGLAATYNVELHRVAWFVVQQYVDEWVGGVHGGVIHGYYDVSGLQAGLRAGAALLNLYDQLPARQEVAVWVLHVVVGGYLWA